MAFLGRPKRMGLLRLEETPGVGPVFRGESRPGGSLHAQVMLFDP